MSDSTGIAMRRESDFSKVPLAAEVQAAVTRAPGSLAVVDWSVRCPDCDVGKVRGAQREASETSGNPCDHCGSTFTVTVDRLRQYVPCEECGEPIPVFAGDRAIHTTCWDKRMKAREWADVELEEGP